MNTIRIGIAQVPQTGILQKNLDKVIEFIEKAYDKGVELLCFPETHLPGYRVGILTTDSLCDEDGLKRATDSIRAKCAEYSMGIILGTETPNPQGKPFNSALVLDTTGKTLALHHKSKLTPADAKGYSPGKGPTGFTFKGIPMGVVICFEGFRFPETTRELARNGAKVVFHPQCNHIMPKMSWKQPIHEALIMARAGENTIYFISANMSHPLNNCRSLVVAPNGLIQNASVLTQEMLITADIYPDLSTHAFLQDDLNKMAKALGEK
ncbi:MAG: carbon-nitrogen hydrolase family protein [Candidatus Latescibacteria bacterium]|nr:carbon-nitrogen hydrolase family protein [Candidatus Latescibacterota bacterium]